MGPFPRSRGLTRPIGGPAVLGALDDLIGEGRWEAPKNWGQFRVLAPVQRDVTSSSSELLDQLELGPTARREHTDGTVLVPPHLLGIPHDVAEQDGDESALAIGSRHPPR